MFTRLLPHLPVWRRALRRRRRSLALLVAALAVVLVLPALVPASMQSTSVVVAAGDLPTGTELGPQHLRTVEVASSLVPSGASSSVGQLEGERLAGPVSEGGAVLPADLVGAEGPAIPEGTALVAVPVPEVLLPHLAAGTRIELLMNDPVDGTGSRIPAEIRSLSADATTSGSLASPGSTGTEALVLVERQSAGDVAHALGAGTVTVSVIG
jgi:Flp pilus assembly protein CpaB